MRRYLALLFILLPLPACQEAEGWMNPVIVGGSVSSGTTMLSCYTTAGDGTVYDVINPGTWAAVQSSSTGATASYTGSYGYVIAREFAGTTDYYRIDRLFLPFDTSGLPDTCTITAANLKLYVSEVINQDNDGYDYLRVVQTDQPSTTALTTADFNNCGTEDSPTAGATDTDLGTLSALAYNTIALNATGLTWISKTGVTMLGVREGHDAEQPTAGAPANDTNNTVEFVMSEGTGNDPLLEVYYTP